MRISITRISHWYSKLIYLGTILLSCTTVTPVSKPLKQPEQVHQAAEIRSEKHWLPRQIVANRQYLVRDSLIISIAGDSLHSRTSQISTTYSTRIIQLTNSLLFTARIDSLTMISSAPSFKTLTDTNQARESEIMISPTGEIISLPVHSSLCSSGVPPAAMRVQEFLIGYPKKVLKAGDKWADTISTTICHSMVLLHQRTIREYTIVNFSSWNQQPSAVITCTTSSTFSSDPKNSSANFSADGSQKGAGVLNTDQATGALLESDMHSETLLRIRTSRGTFAVRQLLTTHIQLRQ